MSSDDLSGRPVVDVDHEPARASSIIAIVAGLIAALTSAPFALLAIPFGFGGFLMLAAGLFISESRAWVTVGAAGIFSGGLVASATGGLTVELMLLSIIGIMVAWDVGQNAISLGEQLTSQTITRRTELVHAGVTALLASVIAGAAYGIYIVGTGGYPEQALALLILGAVVLMWAIRS